MTLVIAHRGASAYAPENSREAFDLARSMGADGIELDVHLSADDHLVVHHDPDIEGRPIRQLPLGEIEDYRLPNGESIPTLQDTVERFSASIQLFIEVKALTPAGDTRLLYAIDAAPTPSHCHVHSFDHRIVQRLRQRRPELSTGALLASRPIDPARVLRDCDADAAWIHDQMLDRNLLVRLQDHGLRVYVWTVDDPDRIAVLVEWGVDGVCTNQPDVARRIVQ